LKAPKEDEAAAENEEAEVDIVPPFIAHAQTPLPILPRERPLHHPAVPAQSLLRLDAGRAMRAVMPRRRKPRRFLREEYALPACSLSGR
jgi:hypothetical protein